MGEAYWKRKEREIRKVLGLERDVHLGEAGADGVNEWLVMELKCRKALPWWLCDALTQASNRADEHQLPVAILHGKGEPWQKDLVVMALGDFEDWFGGESQKSHNLLVKELAKQLAEEGSDE